MQTLKQHDPDLSSLTGENDLCFSPPDYEIKIYIDLTKEQRAAIRNLINPKETIIYAGKVTKINKRSLPQKRFLVITNKTIYNIKHTDNFLFNLTFCSNTAGYSIQRKIKVDKISSITLSVHPFSQRQQFIINVKGEHDYFFNGGSKRDMIVESILTAHFSNTYEPFVFYSREETDLTKFHTTKDDLKAKVNKRPTGDKILIAPEIAAKGLEWIIYNRKALIDYSNLYCEKISSKRSTKTSIASIELNSLNSKMPCTVGSSGLPLAHYSKLENHRPRPIDPVPRYLFNQSKHETNETQSQTVFSPLEQSEEGSSKMDIIDEKDEVSASNHYEIMAVIYK